ncbi:MAG: RsmE family RNA methyltransferase [Victivallaceae bacterium]|nr:RsmE family RNA methyltransferase [Victivallaceae bacterium]
MNLLLMHPEEIDGSFARIRGERVRHLERIGGQCRAGILGGGIGHAKVLEQNPADETALLELDACAELPPPPLPVTLVMALPRPKTLRKAIACAVSMGVKELHFLQSFKVEKSYWTSPFLKPDFLAAETFDALMQAVDTIPARFFFHRQFKPFVEDELPGLCRGRLVAAAHPGGKLRLADLPPPGETPAESVLLLGPEGGWTEYEYQKLLACSNTASGVTLGRRILRTEFALARLLGALSDRAIDSDQPFR